MAIVLKQPAAAAPSAATSDLCESRLFETVRLIREWVESSFSPEQEERFYKRGRLRARFDVDLGDEMCGQLQAYMRASFALSKLAVRLVEGLGSKPGETCKKPCVEVILTPEARELYAQKCPDAVARHRPALCAEDASKAMEVPVLCLTDIRVPQDVVSNRSLPTPPSKRHNDEGNAEGTPTGKRLALSTRKHKEVAVEKMAPQEATIKQGTLQQLPQRQQSKGAATIAGSAKSSAPAPVIASVWEAVPARTVSAGLGGLLEAKEALEAGNKTSGLAALKAEKEAVAWLKGLASCEVGAANLRDSRIGLAVNLWRKHKEPYVASLALELLQVWRATWREAEATSKHTALAPAPSAPPALTA